MHVILLDNRYENDFDTSSGTGDALGEDQWLWLDFALKRGKNRDVTLTLIGAGMQMTTERALLPTFENFHWVNRERLYKTLRLNEMNNVALLSGDVHFGEII